MSVPFKLPTPKRPGEAPKADARVQLETLYRAIGISAVASALHMNTLPAPEDRDRPVRNNHDILPILREGEAA